MSRLMGAMVAVALVVLSLWGWGAARGLVEQADKPELALWAVRSASVAAFAAAQALGLTFVADGISSRRRRGREGRPDRAGELMRLGAGFVCTLALIGAIAMGIVSR
jgi:hypothetical protein